MGQVTILKDTTKNPLQTMGEMAGVCWDAPTIDRFKNKARGIDCLTSGHGRVAEYPQVYMVLDGYSARVIREFYTHIGGMPTRLQSSTRYVNYNDFEIIIPPTVLSSKEAIEAYQDAINQTRVSMRRLEELGIPREDIANLLPLGMGTKVVVRTNLRNLIDMAHQRVCTRAYWEFRQLMKDIITELSYYSEEWGWVCKEFFVAKCDVCGYCTEKKSCGRRPRKEDLTSSRIEDLIDKLDKYKEVDFDKVIELIVEKIKK